jgi:hypothetical protein
MTIMGISSAFSVALAYGRPPLRGDYSLAREKAAMINR